MSLTRRTFLAGTAAAIALPAYVGRATPTDVDVIIVGAGAAGLAAAQSLARAGRSFVVLEARKRRGGRAVTDTGTLGVPFDLGAHWLHNADLNPFMQIARATGRDLRPSPPSDILILQDGRPVPEGAADLSAAFPGLERRLWWKSLWQDDFALAEIDLGTPWRRAAADIAAFTMAVDADALSVEDFAGLAGGEDYVVQGGFGRLVAEHTADVPVSLGHQVDQIAWGSDGRVTASGPFGAVSGRTALLTVPTSVLADQGIRFDPPLPEDKSQAIEDLRCGHFLKVGMRVPSPLTDFPEYGFDIARARRGAALALHFQRYEPVATLIASGRHAEELADLPEQELFAVARQTLSEVAGHDLARAVTAFAHHDWSADSFAKGAYSVRKVGASEARETYARPIANRLFFAGEAAGAALSVTVAGAHLSGISAASAIAKTIS